MKKPASLRGRAQVPPRPRPAPRPVPILEGPQRTPSCRRREASSLLFQPVPLASHLPVDDEGVPA